MYHDIINQRPNWRKSLDPFWKLKVTDEEYLALKDFIKDNFYKSSQIAREVTLFFSEWWKREYTGGPHRKIDVARSLSLEDESDKLYRIAKDGAERLKLDYIRGENTRYLDTMLLQGGLPLKALSNNDGTNRYKNYLSVIIKYISSHYVHWESTEFIQNFNQYISASFQNEIMYALTLNIVKAVQNDDDTYFPFNTNDNQFDDFVETLRATKTKTERTFRKHPFRIKWSILKTNECCSFQYKLDYDLSLSKEWVSANLENNGDAFPRITLMINNRSVNTYIKSNNGDFYARQKNEIKGLVDDLDDNLIDIRLITNTNQIFNLFIPNCEIPDLSNPLTFARVSENSCDSSETWSLVNSPVSACVNAVLFSDLWHTDKDVHTLEAYGQTFNWCEFENQITLSNSNEVLNFDTNFSFEFYADFGLTNIDWVEKSNYQIIRTNPKIHVYDFEDKPISERAYHKQYRLSGDNEWCNYVEDLVLPIGLIEFKITLTKNSQVIREKIYHIGKINYKVLKAGEYGGIVQWDWNEGVVTPVLLNDQIDINEADIDNQWQIKYGGDITNYPATTRFELIGKADKKILKIDVVNPFKGVILLNPNGQPIGENESICINALLGYRCLVLGEPRVRVRLDYYLDDTCSSPQASFETSFYKGLDNPLYILEEDIRNMFKINSHSFLEYNDKGEYYLTIGRERYKLDIFNGDSRFINDKFEIIHKRGLAIKDFNHKVHAVPVNCSLDSIDVFELNKDENGYFYNDNLTNKEIIIFSSTSVNSSVQIRPRYHNLGDKCNIASTPIINSHEEKIQIIKNDLLTASFDDPIWDLAIKYFQVACDYNLPFETFIHLNSISRDKKLMVQFFIHAISKSFCNENQLLIYLTKFESEYAQAWHWIPVSVWNDAVNNYTDSLEYDIMIQLTYQKEFLKRILNLLTYHLHEANKEKFSKFLMRMFNEEYEDATKPSLSDIRNLKAKFNNGNGVHIPKYISDIYPNIPSNQRNQFSIDRDVMWQWGGLLLSPLFSALAFSDIKEVFVDNYYWQYQRVLYYMSLDTEWYFDVFERMTNRINKRN